MMPCCNSRFLLLLMLMGSCLNSIRALEHPQPQADQINLALRRTADLLLRDAGDQTSRIPAVEQTAPLVWRVRMEHDFSYENLPGLLQASLDRHNIVLSYEVAVRRCTDNQIDLGYHQFDWLKDSLVPCKGRTFNEECHFIEITFLDAPPIPVTKSLRYSWVLWLLLGGGLATGFFLVRSRNKSETRQSSDPIVFGQSQLDVAGQILSYGQLQKHLTFRETKLLHLFVTHVDQILERDVILQQVWADEGVLVGRSVDVFVSRLRKKLAPDGTISIESVHGVGYRLETGKDKSIQVKAS